MSTFLELKSNLRVLDYSRGVIYSKLNVHQVCAICFTLMLQPEPSFDVVNETEFITRDFIQDTKTGEWKFAPLPKDK